MRWFLLFVLSLLFVVHGYSHADSTNEQDGSLNTNTVDSTVSSNNNSTDQSTSNTYNGAGSSSDIPVGSAIAPSYMSNGIETCLQGTGSSQTGRLQNFISTTTGYGYFETTSTPSGRYSMWLRSPQYTLAVGDTIDFYYGVDCSGLSSINFYLAA